MQIHLSALVRRFAGTPAHFGSIAACPLQLQLPDFVSFHTAISILMGPCGS
jgi:hypothetical protein